MVPLPGAKFVLDGERLLEQLRPLPIDGATMQLRTKLLGVSPKGKGALVETVQTLEMNGAVYCRITSGAFMVGAKIDKPVGRSNSLAVPLPTRAPDCVVEEQTSVEQAHLYRLSGDYNPLHIDPEMAQMNGFERPILHGLCTFGFATRAVIKSFCGNDPTALASIRVRFAKPVLPGQTLVTSMWRTERDTIAFNVTVKETGKVVVNNACAKLKPKANL